MPGALRLPKHHEFLLVGLLHFLNLLQQRARIYLLQGNIHRIGPIFVRIRVDNIDERGNVLRLDILRAFLQIDVFFKLFLSLIGFKVSEGLVVPF